MRGGDDCSFAASCQVSVQMPINKSRLSPEGASNHYVLS